MARRKILSNFTVPDREGVTERFNQWLNVLRIRNGALLYIFLTSYLLVIGPAEAQVQVAGESSSAEAGLVRSSPPVDTPLETSISVQTEIDRHPTTMPNESLSTSVSDDASKVATKADFLTIKSSNKAIDLAPVSTNSLSQPHQPNSFEPLSSEATSHEKARAWIVAAETLPLLDVSSQSEVSEDVVLEPMKPKHQQEVRVANPLSTSSRSPIWTIAADPGNPELPPILTCPDPDPELGCIRLQTPPDLAPPPPPILYLIPRLDFFRSNNLLLGIDPIDDGLIRPALSLLAVPPLGPDTYILASVEGSYNRYFKSPVFNYTELRIRAGLLQRLSPTMTAEVGWTNQQLFIANNENPGFPSGTRFLNDQAVRFELSRRDQFTDRLFLNSIYQFRVGFSNPEDRSRILNVLFLSLNWDLNPARTVQLGLDYQFSAANYTVVQRTDIYQQLLGRITVGAFRNSQLSVYSGISFGNSTERGIDFNSFVLGVSMSVNLVLF